MAEDLLLHPALPLAVAAALCAFVPARASRVLVVAAPLVALAQLAVLDTGTTVAATYLEFDLEVLRADGLARPFSWVFATAALIAGIYGLKTQTPRERTSALAYAAAAMVVVFAGDLMTFFIGWEIKAIASSFLILSRRGGNSSRAGMRYLFVHVLGGKLLLAGVLWHHATTGSLAFDAFEMSGATILILLACALSAGIPPLHAWLPDAYPEASIAGTVFLSAYTTKAAVYALARGFAGWDVLLWVGVAMALYGVVYAVLENDVRRLLGYHIISQVGYMVAAVGVGTELAINGAAAHAFAHILYKGLLLMGVGAVIHATGREKMTELGGLAHRMKPVLTLYMIGAVSISSFPLFSGFVSKELAVQAVSGASEAALIALKVASVGTFLHTGLKLPYGTWFGTKGAGPRTDADAPFPVGPVPVSMYVAMGISAAANLAIGVFPTLLYGLLPHDEIYDVYKLGKVVETSQILLFTALASWLLLAKLGPQATISLDTDWLYRRLPQLVRASRATPDGRSGRDGGGAPAGGTATTTAQRRSTAGLVAVRDRVVATIAEPSSGPPPLAITWLLGLAVLGAGVLFLVLSLGGGP